MYFYNNFQDFKNFIKNTTSNSHFIDIFTKIRTFKVKLHQKF